ncbi:MAG TPA: DNA-binding response regulator [Dehalococcoidia bacterium]|nr:DNA-binding response regulator [Dehalococcoidia bacterium]
MAGEKILVVDDEENILEAIKYSLSKEGYEVYGASDGEMGLEKAKELSPNLVILDVMLPSLDGFEVCRILRKDMDVPVFMISAKSEEIDRVVGLEIGADDYITKPFSMRELMARVRNALRRANEERGNANSSKSEKIVAGELEINLSSHTVRLSGMPIEMKPREFSLLSLLASNAGRVYSRYQILEILWGHAYIGDVRTVDVHVRWIREKIEYDPSRPTKIITVRGVGYRFDG